MLTHFGTLFAIWHIYHSLTHDHTNVSRGTLHCVQSYNDATKQSYKHIACNHTNKMFHVEQRNMTLTIFNKEIFKNIWNVSKKVSIFAVLIKT